MIRYCRLNLPFDTRHLPDDLQFLLQKDWKQHLNTSHFEGDWMILALVAPGGKNISVADALQGESYHPTPLLSLCPAIAAFLKQFKCPLKAVRLMKLNAGAKIKRHKDQDLAYELGEARIHVPLQTNRQVRFLLDNDLIPMMTGECWYINANLYHSVDNEGTTDRIHLVIDCEVNDWLKEIFDLSSEKKERKITVDAITNQHIIENLYLLNTPAAINMAKKLEGDKYS